MIRALPLDERIFQKKIGQIEGAIADASQAQQVIVAGEQQGFDYLVYKTPMLDVPVTQLLGAAGFYLSDIAVTWHLSLDHGAAHCLEQGPASDTLVQRAGIAEIPTLQRLVMHMFLDSRFYNDPFYSVDGADQVFQAWIANAVRGQADAVFWIPEKGVITVKQLEAHEGNIGLMGVGACYRREGVGTTLMRAAIAWFRAAGARTVSVRTQLKNLHALNFYGHCGFSVAGYDLVFARIFSQASTNPARQGAQRHAVSP